jgi:amino acid adenylation domain-containing protein
MVKTPDPLLNLDAAILCESGAYDRGWSVDLLFRAWAKRQPDAPAVRLNSGAVSYGALTARADAIAAALSDMGIGSGDHVALDLPRGLDLIAAQLAVLRLAAAYAPLDPAAPAARRAAMLALLGAKTTLTSDHPALQAPAPPAGWSASPPASGADIAAIMFTSGSTGAPKGVRVRHRGIVRLVRGQWFAQFDPNTVFLAAAPPAFDASHLELWGPLLNGGSVAPLAGDPPAIPDLARTIQTHAVTDIWLTAGLFHLIIDEAPATLTGAKRVFVGGDVVSPRHIRAAQMRHPETVFINGYGPTENSTFTTCYPFAPGGWGEGPAPIGRALAHTRLLIDGEEGELLVAGDGVGAGYLGEDRDQRFRPDPDDTENLIYATGDMVRRRADGGLDFLGRVDRQVKIAGRRIELAGLEQVMREAPGVADAAVLVHVDDRGEKSLIGVVTPARIAIPDLRRHLASVLPAQDIPSRLFAHGPFPLTATGKLDRDRLRAALLATAPTNAAGAALSRLIAIFRDILGPFDAAARFADLGLTSLQIVRAHTRIAAEIGPIPITELFDCPDLAALSQRLTSQPIVKTSPSPTRPAKRATAPGAIAIIGMAGRFPGAADIEQFRKIIHDNIDAISRFCPNEAEDAFDADTRADPAYVGARGILNDVDAFDAGFFAMQPRQAALTDPQHRVLLEIAQLAFDDAGYDPLRLSAPVGVFAGCALNTYLIGHVLADRAEADAFRSQYGVGMYSHLVGALSDTLAARIAYKLNLRGPAATVQSACATALLAVAQACQSLQAGQCDMALAGAASVTFPQKRGYLHQAGGMVSADGYCRPFDARASGTVFGAGAGLVLLKRLDDARADGDTIHAVIRGHGVSNDGADKVAFTAPSARGQSAAIRQALHVANLTAHEIGYVECHGTATPLGDPIELEGLRQAFGEGVAPASCALGSVKANVGHLDAAAGVSGLIKAVLCVRDNFLPAQLHFDTPNPALRLDGGPFYVPQRAGAWPQTDAPRRAGVSAFGVGGANVHLIVEQPPAPMSMPAASDLCILPISASDADTLAADAARLADHLDTAHPDELPAIAATLQHGRRAGRIRAVITAATMSDAAKSLRGPLKGVSANTGVRLLFACPGQGAQAPGMARAAAREAGFAADLADALGALDGGLAKELSDLLLKAGADDSGAVMALRQTSHAQPALVAVGWAMARAFARRGVRPSGVIGHSVGEITAAAVCGALHIQEAMQFAAARGAAMQTMAPGAMLAVRAEAKDLAGELTLPVSLAAINAPGACVVSGPVDAIDHLAADLEARGIAARRLDTSHAFHSAAIDPIRAAIAAAARRASFAEPTIAWISTTTLAPLNRTALANGAYWAAQARDPVRFGEALTALYGETPAALVELGPGYASLGFAARAIGQTQRLGLVAGLDERPLPLDQACAELWALGVDIDWTPLSPTPFARRHLPGRVFKRTRHWIDAPAPLPIQAPPPVVLAPPFLAETTLKQTDEPPMLTELLAVLETVSGAPIAEADAQASFLELGFDSLLLGQVATRIEKTFGVKIGFRQMLSDLPNPAALAAFLAAQAPKRAAAPNSPAPTPAPSAPAGLMATASASGDMLSLFRSQLDALNGLISQQNALLSGAPNSAPAQGAPAPQPQKAPPPATAVPRLRMFDPKASAPAAPLTPPQQAYIADLALRAQRRAGASKAYADRHRSALADPRTASGFRPEWKELAFPIVAPRARGAYLWGLDGEDYIDLVNGYGQTAFGHAPDFVTDAIARQMRDGFAIGPQTPLAGPLAERLADVLGMERVTFCNTGSEAVMAAMRLARTVTGRDKIVVFANDYHGQFDEVLVKPGPAGASPLAAGIPGAAVSNMIVLAYGAPESLDWISANAEDLAAVIVEPVQSRHPELQPFDFVRRLRAITEKAGAALVFDEVVTGFRVDPGGMQAVIGVRADLATYGKVLGGGMPVGVLAGAHRFMDALDGGAWRFGDTSQPEVAPTFFAGTFVRHPLVLAACAATLDHMQSAGPGLQRGLTAQARNLAERLTALLGARAPSLRLETYASWFMLSAAPGERYLPLLCAELRVRGVHVQDGFPCFYTTAHGSAEADRIETAFRAALDAMGNAGFFADGADIVSPPPPHTPPTQSSRAIPLTDAQLEILLAAQYGDTASTAFNESVTLRFNAAIDAAAMARAIAGLAQRHVVLRGRIDANRLSLDPSAAPPVLERSASRIEEVIAHHAGAAFDLQNGPLWRATLCGPEPAPALVFTAHHVICDGWSINLLLTELACLYAGEIGAPAPLSAPGDYVAFAASRQTRPEDMAFWTALYAEAPPPLALPQAPQSLVPFAGATATAHLPADLIARLRKTGARHGCTLFATLFASLQILLAHLSGETDIAIGCPIAGQAEEGHTEVVGHGVQFLPLRSPISAEDTAAERLKAVRTHLNAALAHSSCTYGALVRRLNPPRSPDQAPFISVQFNLERLSNDLTFGAASAAIAPNPKAGAHFDLFFNMIESSAGVRLDVDYRADRYDDETITRWIGNLQKVIEAVAEDSPAPVLSFDILTEDERAWLAARQPSAQALPHDSTITSAFDAMVRETPDATALISRAGALSYRALNARADILAAALAANGLGHGDRVALHLPRSVEAITAMLAILKCGAVYAPLDPGLPPQVMANVIAAMKPKLALAATAAPGMVTLPSLTGAAAFRPIISKTAPAYVMHTSGSTGAPKGVIIPHSGVVRLVRDQTFMPFGPGEVMLHAAPLAFDASTLEIWGALLTGGALVIADQDDSDLDGLQALIARHGVTTAWLTAGLFHAIASDRPAALAGLKVLATGGDVVSPAAVRRVQAAAPGLQIVNGYGPTENTTFTACYAFAPNDAHAAAPIGAPIAHGRAYVCTPDLALAARGTVGELVVAGEGVALGYLNGDPRQRFLAAPKLGEAHVYRTGDFARWTQDGQLAFLGRRDGLVKINGHRVDLAGIEAALRSVPEVGDIGAFVRTVGGSKAIAVAVAVNAGADAAQSVARLRAAALSLLPASHQPKEIQILPALVRTPNGKIDRQALAQGIASPVSAPSGPALPVATPAPAATHAPLVETIAAIWADVLHRERVAVDKGIFDLGADSLHIFRIASRMSDAGIAVTSRRLLSNPSVLMLAAEHESAAEPAPSGASVLPLASFRRDRRTS